MLLTTEYRSHYIDDKGSVYDRRPTGMTGLTPVINLDEVREWLALATSDDLRALGFPGGGQEPAVHYLRLVTERGAETDDHLAHETAREICDDVPVYVHYWRAPFVAMRERRPLPSSADNSAPHPAPALASTINLTPHGIPVFRWRDQREAFVAECLAQGGSSDVSAERDVGNLGRYARNYASSPPAQPVATSGRPGDQVTFYCTTRKGPGVHLTGAPFGTIEEMNAAYTLLARGGATCNDATADEKQAARDAVAAAEASPCH